MSYLNILFIKLILQIFEFSRQKWSKFWLLAWKFIALSLENKRSSLPKLQNETIWEWFSYQFKFLLAGGIEIGDGCTSYNMTAWSWQTYSVHGRWRKDARFPPLTAEVSVDRGQTRWTVNGPISSWHCKDKPNIR